MKFKIKEVGLFIEVGLVKWMQSEKLIGTRFFTTQVAGNEIEIYKNHLKWQSSKKSVAIVITVTKWKMEKIQEN